MTKAQRRRRVEILIDQRLVGFLKPVMTISSGNNKDSQKRTIMPLRPTGDADRETKAS